MSIDATFFKITITFGHNTGKVTSYKRDKKSNIYIYIYIYIHFH